MKEVPEVSQFYTHSQESAEGSAIPSSPVLSTWSRHIAFISRRTHICEKHLPAFNQNLRPAYLVLNCWKLITEHVIETNTSR